MNVHMIVFIFPASNKFTVLSQQAEPYLLHRTLLRHSPSIKWAQRRLVLRRASTSSMWGQLLCTWILFFSCVLHIHQSRPVRSKQTKCEFHNLHCPNICRLFPTEYISHTISHKVKGPDNGLTDYSFIERHLFNCMFAPENMGTLPEHSVCSYDRVYSLKHIIKYNIL